MPQDLHRDPRVNVNLHEERGTRLPGRMHRDQPDTSLAAGGHEAPIEVTRLHRVTCSYGEDQARFVPASSGC